MSRGYCCFYLILCKSHNLVPFAMHRMLLYSYEKHIKRILSGNTNRDNFFRDYVFAGIALKLDDLAQFFQVAIHVHPWLPWVPEVFPRVRRGASFRRPPADTCSAEGRRHERLVPF